ncbi:PAS domain-containing protein [Brasilonema sp. CT11]|nr:PAS domain-containing protein [Brasilonema sp. CT11]
MQRPEPETVTLDHVVITEELSRRSPRPPNLQAENQALHALVRQLVNQPEAMLQSIVDMALDLCSAQSAGVSLLETTPTGEEIFRWNVLAGTLKQYVGNTAPRNFSPSGTCLDGLRPGGAERGTPVLFSYPSRYFTYLQETEAQIVEILVLPLIANNDALGTIWIVSHWGQQQFDSEDLRVMTSLADFTATALLVNQRQTRELLAANAALEAEIVERKRTEESARESYTYFRSIVNLVPDMLWRSDVTGDTSWYNQRWLDYTGQTMEEAQGYGWLEVIHPGDRAQSLANFQNAVDEGRPLRQEHRIRGTDGNYRWFLIQVEPVFDSDGRIIQWFGAATDIHEQRWAIEQSHESEQRLRVMIENLPGGAAFVVDRDLRYLLAEGEALSAAGFKTQDLVGKTIFEAMPPELTAKYEKLYRMALAGESFELEHNSHDRFYISRGTPLRTKNGEVYAVLAVSYDISERKKAEVALRESEELFRLFVTASSDIIYRISADWSQMRNLEGKNILASTENPSHTWLETYIPKEQQPQVWAVIQEAIRTKSTFELEHRVIQQNGTIGWTFSRAIPMLNEQGEIIEWFGTASDVTDRKQTEAAIAQDLRDTQLLHELSARLVTEGDIQVLYDEIVAAAITITRADAGTVQILDEATQDLLLLATQGFERNVIDRFSRINASSNTPCGIALATGDRTFVDFDVPQSEDPDGSMRIHVEAGYLSAQSTPLITRSDKAIGMVSTHWRKHHRPSDRQLQFLDLLARQAADLIEQRQAQAALRESEAKYRFLFNSMDEGYFLCDVIFDQNKQPVDLFYVDANPSATRMVGQNFTGRRLREIDPGYEAYWYEIFGRVAGTGIGERLERYAEPDKRWYDFYVFKVGDEDRRRIAVVFNDISDRKRNEQHQSILSEITDELVSLNNIAETMDRLGEKIGRYFGVTQCMFAELTQDFETSMAAYGWNADGTPSLKGTYRIRDFLSDEQMAANMAGGASIVNDTQTDPRVSAESYGALGIRSFVIVPLMRDKLWRFLLSIIDNKPREWRDDEVDLLREITNRIWTGLEGARAEAALRESEIQRAGEQSAREQERQRAETLAELDHAKTVFFSNVSHEFRTPLTLLLAPLQDALSDHTHLLPQPQRERLELVHRNSLRLLKLVNTLLDFSRIEAGRMEAVYEATDLALLTTELASVFRSAIERAGLGFRVDCPPLPESVYVDREMWEKIVLNLLSNAFKFTFEGEIGVKLHPADDHYVRLQVQDTGTGIPPEEVPHLFERFYQIRGTKARTHEGSGIGLALVYELIRLHGGTVDVSSTVERGSCFTITIPLGTAHLPSDRLRRVVGDRTTATRTQASTAIGAAPYVQEAGRWLLQEAGEQGSRGTRENKEFLSSAPPPLRPSARILVVDDNADMRDYLTRILSEHVQVEAVADGAAALAAVQERVPDLVLSDVMMPGLDGFELLKALRADARTKEVPIILLSARAGVESVVEGLEAGADDYLIKPFSVQELVSRVNAHLQMAHLRLEVLRQEKTTSRRKDEMLSIVSHELNTPLVAILGWTRLLRANPPSHSMLMKSLETIERNATLQAKLISDLLDISRITAGKLHLNLEPVELQSVIETAIACGRATLNSTVDQTQKTKDIELTCLLDPRPIIVQGDPERLQQIVLNLLINAIKFTPKGGRIEIHLNVKENQAQIKVSDTGCGISAEFMPHVFESFRQAQSTKSQSIKGLGLGLAIARHLVELHGGTIYAESPGIGQGATFTVMLPRDGC